LVNTAAGVKRDSILGQGKQTQAAQPFSTATHRMSDKNVDQLVFTKRIRPKTPVT
jgi:hypothetical protein